MQVCSEVGDSDEGDVGEKREWISTCDSSILTNYFDVHGLIFQQIRMATVEYDLDTSGGLMEVRRVVSFLA